MMIFRRRLSWLRLLVQLRGSVLPRIWKRLAITTSLAIGVAVVHNVYGLFSHTLGIDPFTIIALALGIFLGFRNNTSYERFWEGRKLWGTLVNNSRTMARRVLTLVVAPTDAGSDTEAAVVAFHRELVMRTIAYVHALRLHLRDQGDFSSLSRFLPHDEVATFDTRVNVPGAILERMAWRLTEAYRKGWIHPHHLPIIDESLDQYTEVQGGCERIKQTPIPFSYTMLMHRIVGVYCLALPFGIVDQLGLMTPVVVLLVSYAFFGLDAIGEEIENPFGFDTHDLPLLHLSTMVETDLLQHLGSDDLPDPIQPKDYILL